MVILEINKVRIGKGAIDLLRNTQTGGIALKDEEGVIAHQEFMITLDGLDPSTQIILDRILSMIEDFFNDDRISIQMNISNSEYHQLMKARGMR